MKKNWEIKTLGEVCDFVRGPFGGSLKKNCFVEKGYAVYEQQNAIYNRYEFRYFIDANKFCEMSRFKVNSGDLIMSCSGTMGKISIVPNSAPEGIINQALLKLTIKKEIINTYLKCYIESETFQDTLKKLAQGVAVENVASVKILKQIPIPIPPIKEQEEIVEKLDKGFELIDSLKETAKKNLDNAKELFQSVLREELSPKEGWETKTLGEAGTTLTGQTPPTKDKDNFGNYIPFVKPADFLNGELNYLNEGLSEKGMKFSRVSKKGSTLMVCIGATIGKTAFTELDITSNQQINTIYPSKDFSPKYIYYSLISNDFYNQVIKNSSQATLPIINKSKWENLTISFPNNIKEQEEIVGRLDRIKGYCEELEGNYKRVLELCEELKQGLLREAFEVR